MLHSVALVLLTMVGYSSGVVFTKRGRSWEPAFYDLLAIAALWVVVFSIKDGFGRWTAIGIAVVLGLITSAIITTIKLAGNKTVAIPDSELPEHARDAVSAESVSLPRRALHAWQNYGAEMGGIQGRLIMGFFYFIILTPFALFAMLGGDALERKKAPGWSARETVETTLESASEQG